MINGVGYKSYSQKKREGYDYRGNYLKHNHGLLGSIYICSQCLEVMHKDEMQVDHIFPVSKWFAPNRVFNCVSICPHCNKTKSNRITKSLVIKGILMKLFEEFYIAFQRAFIYLFRLAIILLVLLGRVLMRPLLSDRSIPQKAAIVGFYAVVLKIILSVI